MPVKGCACPVRDALLCNVIMLLDFSPLQLSSEDVFFFFLSIHSHAKLSNPAVVKSFALGFLYLLFLYLSFDHYLTIAAHGDIKAVWKCQME